MPEEIGTFIKNLIDISEYIYGDLKIYSGFWEDPKQGNKIMISLAWSGWGKVSSSRATTRLISHTEKSNKIDLLIFTGVAGAAKKVINQWDVVIPEKLIQHDMDARPLFNRYEIPALKKGILSPPNQWIEWAKSTIEYAILSKQLVKFNEIHTGLLATGDTFISEEIVLNDLNKRIPNLLALEMEGAAFAQVACQENIPWLVIRTISNNADGLAAQEFTEFLSEYKFESNKLLNILIKNHVNAPWEKKSN